MNYAPIIIPTLNRYEHLYNCLESLKKNKLADMTEVYISVDYPPADKYIEGHNRVVEYLEKGITGFREVHVIYQDKNLGASENSDFLYTLIRGKADRFIYTEDDNVFSPCFLEYINKGLERFKKDDCFALISGFNSPWHRTYSPYNYGKEYCFMPWGYAMYTKTYDRLLENISREQFLDLLRNEDISRHLYTERPELFRTLFETCMANKDNARSVYRKHLYKNGNVAPTDLNLSVIMHLNNMYCICPELSMVRNCGNEDGSGQNVAVYDGGFKYSEQEIETGDSFEFLPSIMNEDVHDYDAVSIPSSAKRAWILRRVYLLFGVKVVRIIMELSFSISRYWGKITSKTDYVEYNRV
ncbi:MAG: glycosyltransferase family 2 protein [Lachnospiraceae bacterium]|nr:glycosyltransferase family 2 protein [Lachnospiraceae bacterium]